MSFSILKPSLNLAPFVKHYWTMDSQIKSGEKHIQRIVPSGFLEWTFYFQDQPIYLRGKKQDKSQAMISGQQYGYYDISVTGHIHLFSIVFSPFGARYLLGLPASEFKNQSISADLVHKNLSDEITVILHEAKSNPERKQSIERILIKLIRRQNLWNIDRLSSVFQQINQTKGHIDIKNLASVSCLSRKQFERNFIEHVGISPKKYLRIIRFQHALHEKENNSDISLTNLALASNYYDQSHMINDFRYFTGLSPRAYFSQCPSYSDYFN